MTLKEKYFSLSEVRYPKKEMIEEISKEFEVSISTAKNWVMDKHRPSNKLVCKQLAAKYGLDPDKLFKPKIKES